MADLACNCRPLCVDALYAGMCARRRTFFSCLPKKRRQKKGTPLAASLRCAAGNLRCLRVGCAAELTALLRSFVRTAAASQITTQGHAALPPRTPPAARLGASRGDLGNRAGHRCARTWLVRISMPLSPCREAQGLGRVWTPKDGRTACSDWLRLSERRAASAKRVPQRRPRSEHRRLPAGTRAVGSPFLCLLSFGDPKESRCAAGRTSRHTAPLKPRQPKE